MEDFCKYMDATAAELSLLDDENIPHAGDYSALCVDSASIPPMLRIAL